MAIPSPCIQLCVLDRTGRCTGCGRTLDEISRWARMDDAERRAVLLRLAAARKSKLAAEAERRS